MKKQLEFSKLVVVWVVLLTSFSVIADDILAYCGRVTNGETTRTIVASLAATIVTYAVKSFFEKKERNKHNLDENGNPRG